MEPKINQDLTGFPQTRVTTSDRSSRSDPSSDLRGREQKQDRTELELSPPISLPKGSGAIRGIGEKVSVNPVNGTASLTVRLALSAGRSGFGPQLSLSYDSGAGNGPFGFGWNLSLASITRRTDRGIPRYQDGEESDTFILAGSEDLVPILDGSCPNSSQH
jgi:hypothetical protein